MSTILRDLNEIVRERNQDKFNLSIGKLDRVLSELVEYSRGELDGPNKQTLKHHAEDMIAAGECILKKLGIAEGLPQPPKNLLNCPHGKMEGIDCYQCKEYCPICYSKMKTIRYSRAQDDVTPCDYVWHDN